MDKEVKSKEEYEAEQKMLAIPWETATVEEKLEKIKYTLMNQPNHYPAIFSLQNEIRMLKKHEHNAKGEMVIAVKEVDQLSGGLTRGDSLARRNPLL